MYVLNRSLLRSMLTIVKPSLELCTIPGGQCLCLCILRFLFGSCVVAVKAYLNNTWWSVWFVCGCYQSLFEPYLVVGVGAWFINSCRLSIDCFHAQC